MPTPRTPFSERVCGACGAKGHRRDHCPKASPNRKAATCTYCKRRDGTHSKGCRRKAATGGGKRRAKASAAVRSGDNGKPPALTDAAAQELLRERLLEEKTDLQAQLKVIDRLLDKEATR